MKKFMVGCFCAYLGIFVGIFLVAKIFNYVERPSKYDIEKLNVLKSKYEASYSFKFLGTSYLGVFSKSKIIDKKEACEIYKTYILDSKYETIRSTHVLILNYYGKEHDFLYQISAYRHGSGCSYSNEKEFR
jgi:hypothetical protein